MNYSEFKSLSLAEQSVRPLINLGITTPPQSTILSVPPLTSGNNFVADYKGLIGNNPSANGNFVAVFQSPSIPYNGQPAPVNPPTNITGVNPNGQQITNSPFTIGTEFCIGYAVGPVLSGAGQQPYGNICATNYISGSNTQPYPSVSSAITNVQPYATAVNINFQLPSGILPVNNGAWVGIWNNSVASYTTPPIGFAPISQNSPQGAVGINGLSIIYGQTWTVALFMSGWQAGAGGTNVQTAMACTYSFST